MLTDCSFFWPVLRQGSFVSPPHRARILGKLSYYPLASFRHMSMWDSEPRWSPNGSLARFSMRTTSVQFQSAVSRRLRGGVQKGLGQSHISINEMTVASARSPQELRKKKDAHAERWHYGRTTLQIAASRSASESAPRMGNTNRLIIVRNAHYLYREPNKNKTVWAFVRLISRGWSSCLPAFLSRPKGPTNPSIRGSSRRVSIDNARGRQGSAK